MLAKGLHKTERTPWALTIVLCVILLATGVFSVSASLKKETRKAEAVEHEIAIRENEVKQIQALQKSVTDLKAETETIEQFKRARPTTMNLFRELTTVLPKHTWLSRVHITDTNANIEGYSAAPTEIVPKLESSRYFKKVEFASPTYRDARMNADHFAVKMEIEGLPEVKDAKKQ